MFSGGIEREQWMKWVNIKFYIKLFYNISRFLFYLAMVKCNDLISNTGNLLTSVHRVHRFSVTENRYYEKQCIQLILHFLKWRDTEPHQVKPQCM